MDQGILVSVVIPCYNQGKYLYEAVESVRRSTLANYEIIIVDDGSTDEDTRLASEWAVRQGIKVIRQENQGLPNARNAGISIARGQYILALDADDLIGPTYLEKAAWVLNNSPRVGFVTVWLRQFGINDSSWRPPKATVESMREGNAAVASSLFRRKAWEDAGGYDGKMLFGYEDYDFWLSILEKGWNSFLIPEVLFYYRVKPVSKFTVERQKHGEIMRIIKAKHPGIFNAPAVTLKSRIRIILKRKAKESALGRFAVRRLWRDALVLRDHDFLAWLKWRLFPLVKAVPGALALYRRIKRYKSNTTKPKGILEAQAPLEVSCAKKKDGILYLVPWLEMGGADKVNLDLIMSLEKTAFHPVVATTLHNDHPWHEKFCKYTDDVFHLDNLENSLDGKLSFLEHLIRTRNVRLIQISNSLDGYSLLPRIKEKFNIPVVSLVHSYAPSDPWDYPRVAVKNDRYIDLHVAVSDTLAQWMVFLGCSVEKVSTVVNGVNTDLFQPGKNDWVKNKLDIQNDQIVTFIGRLANEKQPMEFLLMVEELCFRRNVDKITFLMVGSGPQELLLRQAIREKGLTGKVFLAGGRSNTEIPMILQSTKILVAPSLFEGLPIIGLEAMACGVPVIASRVEGWSDLIIHGINGLLVDPHDIRGMADAVEDLLVNRERWNSISKLARKTVLDRYALSSMASSYQSIYKKLIS
ncbi:MAG: Glycosyl transferase, family 2 [Desulfotomaculum sp. 46_296]|nr:MAG: Glycosyl transferase, family 2 [Desulfotomaculum sp. 46_296]HAU32589.1 hypothetical protein [Desulfotomaculum sp.]